MTNTCVIKINLNIKQGGGGYIEMVRDGIMKSCINFIIIVPPEVMYMVSKAS